MTDTTRPFSHREPLPPVDQRWALRRQLSRTSRNLSETLVTHDPDTEQLQAALALLQQAEQLLGQGEPIKGKLAWHDRADNGNYHQLSRELAPIGGISNPIGTDYHMWIDFDNNEAHGRVRFGWAFEGPPTFAHGGWVAAVFDEFLGCAQVFCEDPGVTGTLSVRYKQPTPLNTDIVLHAYLKEQVGRKTVIAGTMTANGVVTATCEALFISITGGVKNLAGMPS